MKKVLNVFKVILLLAWLVFLVLCSHSCIMKLNSSMEEGTTPVSAAPASANAGDNAAAAPQQGKQQATQQPKQQGKQQAAQQPKQQGKQQAAQQPKQQGKQQAAQQPKQQGKQQAAQQPKQSAKNNGTVQPAKTAKSTKKK